MAHRQKYTAKGFARDYKRVVNPTKRLVAQDRRENAELARQAGILKREVTGR